MVATNPAGIDTTTPVHIPSRAAREPGEPRELRERLGDSQANVNDALSTS